MAHTIRLCTFSPVQSSPQSCRGRHYPHFAGVEAKKSPEVLQTGEPVSKPRLSCPRYCVALLPTPSAPCPLVTLRPAMDTFWSFNACNNFMYDCPGVLL